jgi:hypothetical protein
MRSGRDRLTQVSEEVERSVDRVELATALLQGFAEPVPEYEPEFKHLGSRLSQYQISGPSN